MPDQEIIQPTRLERRPSSIKGMIPALPERGKIKIGVKGKTVTSKSGTEFQPPKKLDHFIVTTLERGADGNFLKDAAIHAIIGDEPKTLKVRLLYDDPDLNLMTRYACYNGRSVFCVGDGEQATRVPDANKPNDKITVKCTCERLEASYAGRGKCKPNGVLSVILDGVSGLGGVWKFRTTAWNTVSNLRSQLYYLRSITGGILANIPFDLEVYPKQVEVDGKQTIVYVVGLTFAGNMEGLEHRSHEVALHRAQHRISIQQIEDEARLRLPSPLDVLLPGDEADDVVDEFYPDDAKPVSADPPPRRTITTADLTADLTAGSSAESVVADETQSVPEQHNVTAQSFNADEEI